MFQQENISLGEFEQVKAGFPESIKTMVTRRKFLSMVIGWQWCQPLHGPGRVAYIQIFKEREELHRAALEKSDEQLEEREHKLSREVLRRKPYLRTNVLHDKFPEM